MVKKLIPIILIVFTIIMAAISYIILPDTVVVQITMGGKNGTTMPKLIAILLPASIGLVGGGLLLTVKEKTARIRAWVLSIVSIVVYIFTWVVNLL